MSVLVSIVLLIQLLLLLLNVDVYKTECAIGNPSKYTKGIKINGRLKYDDYNDEPNIDDFETLGRDGICLNDELYNSPYACICTYVKSNGSDSGGIYSCGGENIKSLPNITLHASNNEIRLYSLVGAKHIDHIKPYQFKGMKVKEIRIKSIDTLTIEEQAFQGIFNLEILKITNNNLSQIGNPKYIFAGLENLTVLDLSHNGITGWNATETSTDDTRISTPVVPKLKILNLSGNLIESFNNDTFTWLQGSQLEHLILHNCCYRLIMEFGTLLPVTGTLRSIDFSNTQIGNLSLWILTSGSNSSLQSLSLADINLPQVPYQALCHVNQSLQYFSLKDNPLNVLGKENGMSPRSGNSQDREAGVFPYMPNLEELDLRGCLISFIQNGIFDNFPKLRSLFLSNNFLTSFSNLVSDDLKLSYLTYLDISHNQISSENIHLTSYSALEILDLSYNKGITLTKNFFMTGKSSLKKLSLCYTNLKITESEAFSNLSTLEVLDLSGNIELSRNLSSDTFKGLISLEELHLIECNGSMSFRPPLPPPPPPHHHHHPPPHVRDSLLLLLHPLKNLRKLNLQKNYITFIPNETIQHLEKLDSLDLSNNLIGSWNEPVFSDSKVRSLNIGHNYLNYITDAMLTDFESLTTLVIASNPFVCDCNCLEFIKMINNMTETSNIVPTKGGFKTVDFNIQYESHFFTQSWDSGDEYMCTNKSTNRVHSISFENITCKISSKETEPELDNEGSNDSNEKTETIIITVAVVSLVVIVFGGITYWKWWYIRYFAILVKNATVLSFISSSDDESLYDKIFIYDVFISYSDHNREWVLNNLLTNLESTSNIKVCLHERDFQVGIGILENIIACMDQSRSILLVISQQFLKSQWCQFELHLAQHRLLETRREELILLFLEDIPRMKRPKTLNYLMRTKTYIQWPKNAEDADAVKLFWKRVRNAILRNSNEISKRGVSTV